MVRWYSAREENNEREQQQAPRTTVVHKVALGQGDGREAVHCHRTTGTEVLGVPDIGRGGVSLKQGARHRAPGPRGDSWGAQARTERTRRR